ncbi:MAG: hypothetical protein QOD24_2792 [Solirubrobacteraceae bacterium]|jgi:hypothetical protein|nr:hypothetical protein [Solirubrobacteraceae bacterium]
MRHSDGSGVGDSGATRRSGSTVRVADTDLAILKAFCRPYLDGDRRFVSPTPNNEILRELTENGIYLDIDALRGHLRNLYAKFGVEDGLNPAQKRARLVELVYEHGVIPGWAADEEEPTNNQTPLVLPAPAWQGPSTTSSLASGSSERPEPTTGPKLRGLLRDRSWIAVGAVAVLALVSLAVLVDVGSSDRSQDPAVIAKQVVAANSTCESGEFCLGRLYNLSGGLYQGRASDPNLSDNTFYYFADPNENKKLGRVTNQSWSASNESRHDVVVYEGPDNTGERACIHVGPRINLPERWKDRISSFRFTTRSACDRYEVLAK